MERRKISKKEIAAAIKAMKDNTSGYPRMLPVVTLKNRKTYFVDERLKELRNINNPCDTIKF
jgi:hypothetical protein